MRYAPPGFCLNDFEIYEKDGIYHLIHLQGSPVHPFDAARLETSYGHAVSRDLISWETQAPVFGITRFPHFDDSAIWTMSITEYQNKLWMFYTGLTQEPFLLQQVGLAIDDTRTCTGWKRYRETPVASADPVFYQTTGFMGWRDPFVIRDEETDQWVMYICAKTRKRKNGCIGCAVSNNLTDWKIIEPVLSPGTFGEMECPVLFRHDGWWYMLVSVGDDRCVHTYRSRHALGPFEHLGILAPAYNYAPRICTAPNGEPVVLHTVPQKWQALDIGEYMRGKLAQPKKLIFDGDGIPALGWYQPAENLFRPAGVDEPIENGMMVFSVPDDSGSFSARLRTNDETGVELVYDGSELMLRYREDLQALAVKQFAGPKKIGAVRILMHDEYYEVYSDGILELTGLGYRHTGGTCDFTRNGIKQPFSLYRYQP